MECRFFVSRSNRSIQHGDNPSEPGHQLVVTFARLLFQPGKGRIGKGRLECAAPFVLFPVRRIAAMTQLHTAGFLPDPQAFFHDFEDFLLGIVRMFKRCEVRSEALVQAGDGFAEIGRDFLEWRDDERIGDIGQAL